jgi:Spy/CpxP family protein refolding chaperone
MKTLNVRPRPFFAATLALVLGLPLYAMAKGDGHGHGHRRHGPPSLARMLEKNAERLNLDATTLARIQDIATARKDRTKEMRVRAREERVKLHDMLQADNPSEGAVMAQVDILGDLHTDLQKERLSTMLEIRALLTPEQKAELAKLREEKREKFMKHRKDRRERRKTRSDAEGAAQSLDAPAPARGGVWF